jgi:hypothetical protein
MKIVIFGGLTLEKKIGSYITTYLPLPIPASEASSPTKLIQLLSFHARLIAKLYLLLDLRGF